MIQALHLERSDAMERAVSQPAASGSFDELFGETAKTSAPSSNAVAASTSASSLGQPDVEAWLTSYYTEMAATNSLASAASADLPYEAATGAGNDYPAGSVYGPDQIFTQALYNQNGNEFAKTTGGNAAQFTSQLPGVPSVQVQQQFDSDLAIENAQRLATGQAIDTAAYWSDPGSLNYDGHVYTAQELGYAGPAQSSGAEPLYISANDKVAGTNNYTVPGYSGTVSGLKPDCWYTLQQLEQAGLKSGQPDAEFHPGSWSLPTAGGTPAPASASAIPASDS